MAAGKQQEPATAASPAAQLRELQSATATLQSAALDSQEQVAAARRATADLGGRTLLVAAYARRLRRLATLLQQYDSKLQEALAALGLGVEQGSTSRDGLTPADGLRQLEAKLAAAVFDCPAEEAVPQPAALLQLQAAADVAAQVVAAGPAAILAELQDSAQADLLAVDSWPALAAPQQPGAGASASAAASPLGPALARLQQEQRERWDAQVQRRQALEALRAEVATAQQELAAGVPSTEGAARVQLAAKQAALRADVAALDGLRRAAEERRMEAAQVAQRVAEQQATVAAAEQNEAQLDAAIRAMCCADGAVMRQWRQDTWRAQEHVESALLAQRQSLTEVAQQLLQAQQRELSELLLGPSCVDAAACGSQVSEGTRSGGAAVDAARAAADAAARLLDPLAALKTSAHSAALLTAAQQELEQLQAVQQQWQGLAKASSSRLAALQEAAAELEAAAARLDEQGSSAALQQLREAAAAAEEGTAAVARVRQALSEWWTSPAVAAAPWVKHEGKSAEEWLRLLGDQQRAQRQREAFTGKDGSNRIR